MSEHKGQRLAVIGGSVGMATLGLSSCLDNGAVDPAPPPLNCNEIGGGQALDAQATRRGTSVRVRISAGRLDLARWQGSPAVTGVTGATLVAVTPVQGYPTDVHVDLELESETTASARFTLSGQLEGVDSECAVTRTFTLTIGPSGVQVAQRAQRLPLWGGDVVRILVASREGRTVKMAAEGARGRVAWTATGGRIDVQDDGTARWELPPRPGLYQAEVLVDQGDAGFALDTLVLEVV